jgi:serralysin
MTTVNGSGPIGTFPVSGNPLIDPLVWPGFKWGTSGAGTAVVVTYSFPSSTSKWSTDYQNFLDNEPFNGFQSFTATQQTAAKQALALWSEVANITFQQISETATDVGDIRFGNSASVTQSTAAAWAYLPYSDGLTQYPETGDIWFDIQYSPNLQLQPGQFGFATMLHEIGHAIGLDHPFQDSGSEPVLSPDKDTDRYTVMSYTFDSATLAYASTPQLIDILAVQHIYGANMTTRTGDDVYTFSATTQVNKAIWDAAGTDTLDFSNQTGGVAGSLAEGSFSFFCKQEAPTTSSIVGIAYGAIIENAVGSKYDDTLTGNHVANSLIGGAGNDTMTGFDGDDMIDGGAGADFMQGGDGNDTYYVDSTGDKISELNSFSTADWVYTSISLVIAGWFADDAIENAKLLGSASIDIVGNGRDNTLIGNAGSNVIDGGFGADVMIGGKGDDTYHVYEFADVITELAGEGTDTVIAEFSLDLNAFANVEYASLATDRLFPGSLTGNSMGNRLRGNFDANVLIGNEGDDWLNGNKGDDTLRGGAGNDMYVVDSAADVVDEEGYTDINDAVRTTLSLDLAIFANGAIENAFLLGSAALNAAGNDAANVLTGNDGANTLNGRFGADVMAGGLGDDIYVVDSVGDQIIEQTVGPTGGIDLVQSAVAFSAALLQIENIALTGLNDINAIGNGLANTLIGNSGHNLLDGGAANDVLKGGGGDDTYVIDSVGDMIDESGNSDLNDKVISAVAVNLMTLGGGLIEHASLLGTAAANLTGNAAANVLAGNAGANVLDGKGGADHMEGGSGNDIYVVDVSADEVVEASAAGGVDLVQSAATFVLGAYVENLTLTGGAAADATGNELVNILMGNGADNRLDGRAGADTMTAGLGNDTYVIDDLGDVVSEALNAGVDTIESIFSTDLLLKANFENLTLLGNANLDAMGTTGANKLVGNAGSNLIDGRGGADVMSGGGGNDVYIVDDVGDVVEERGTSDLGDEVRSANIRFGALAGIENYIYGGSLSWSFLGTAADNRTSGGSAGDTLDGADGHDTILGNGGDDTLFGRLGNDWLDGGVGNDTLRGGTGNDTILGNVGDDTVFGALGNDWLDGGAGNDKLKGGIGNDTYVLDSAADTIDEEGHGDLADLVRSTVTVNLTTLGAGLIEHAMLLGTGSINATGSAGANILTGNDGANVLDGKGGADELAGGKGTDTYIVDDLGDHVTETIAGSVGGVDLVKSSVTFTLGANLENLTLTESGHVDAFGNELNNALIGNDGNNRLDGGTGNDAMTGGKGDDTYVVNADGDVVNETIAVGGGVDAVESAITFSVATRANVENLILTGAGNINGTGNDLNNHLVGNLGINTLDGGGGDDLIDGAAGDDTLLGNIGNDTLIGGAGADKLTGGAGRDVFDFDQLLEAGDTITDFAKGATGDVLDLRDILDGVGYGSADPFADQYLTFTQSGTNTIVSIDADGAGIGAGSNLVTLLNVTLTQSDTANYLL